MVSTGYDGVGNRDSAKVTVDLNCYSPEEGAVANPGSATVVINLGRVLITFVSTQVRMVVGLITSPNHDVGGRRHSVTDNQTEIFGVYFGLVDEDSLIGRRPKV